MKYVKKEGSKMTREEGIEFGILWFILTYVMHEFHYFYVAGDITTIYEKALYSASISMYLVWTFMLFTSYICIFTKRGKKNEKKEKD